MFERLISDGFAIELKKLDEATKGFNSILLVTGEKSYKKSGAKKIVDKVLAKKSVIHVHYSGIALPIEDIDKIYRELPAEKFDCVVAIGGGTVLDIAKVLALLLSNKCHNAIEAIDNKKLENKLNIVAVPTTCGTGSEATHFAVVYRDKIKYSVAHHTLLPHFVILDHHLLTALPEKVKNATILDALAQAIESLWAKEANEVSRSYGTEAIRMILDGLHGKKKEQLKNFLWGSNRAGIAINISKTTLPHAISYPLTTEFNISHGIAVFLTLAEVAEKNHTPETKEIFDTLFSLFDLKDIRTFKAKLADIFNSLGFSTKLRDYGISKDDLLHIAALSIVPGRSDNNPIEIDKKGVLEILEKIF